MAGTLDRPTQCPNALSVAPSLKALTGRPAAAAAVGNAAPRARYFSQPDVRRSRPEHRLYLVFLGPRYSDTFGAKYSEKACGCNAVLDRR